MWPVVLGRPARRTARATGLAAAAVVAVLLLFAWFVARPAHESPPPGSTPVVQPAGPARAAEVRGLRVSRVTPVPQPEEIAPPPGGHSGPERPAAASAASSNSLAVAARAMSRVELSYEDLGQVTHDASTYGFQIVTQDGAIPPDAVGWVDCADNVRLAFSKDILRRILRDVGPLTAKDTNVVIEFRSGRLARRGG